MWTGADGATVVRILKADGSIERTIVAPDGATFPSTGFAGCAGHLASGRPTAARWRRRRSIRPSGTPSRSSTSPPGTAGSWTSGCRSCTYAWSPAGSLLAFTGGVYGDQAVYVVEPDGSDLRRLSPDGRQARLFQFAPDGTWMLADIEDEGAVMLELDGTYEAVPADTVSVAPDGRSAALLRGDVGRMYGDMAIKDNTSGPRELYVGSLDGAFDERLVAGKVSGPGSWSPDGALLAAWTTAVGRDPHPRPIQRRGADPRRRARATWGTSAGRRSADRWAPAGASSRRAPSAPPGPRGCDPRAAAQRTTMLTSRPSTWMTFTTSLPSRFARDLRARQDERSTSSARQPGRHRHQVAELAVDLDRQLDLVGGDERRVPRRPGLGVDRAPGLVRRPRGAVTRAPRRCAARRAPASAGAAAPPRPSRPSPAASVPR